MKIKHLKGIRGQMLLLGILPMLLLFISLLSFFVSARLTDIDRSTDEVGELLSSQLAVATEFGVMTGNKEHVTSIINQAMSPDIAYIQVIDRFGKLLAEARNPHPDVVNSDLNLYLKDIYRVDLSIDEPTYNQPPSSDQERLGSLVVALSKFYSNQSQRDVLSVSICLGLFLLAVSILFAFTVGRRILNPLLDLTDAVQKISHGRLNTRLETNQQHEIGELQHGFNAMAEKLEANQLKIRKNLTQLEKARRSAEKASSAKSEFLATMSHELRTPMNGALGTLDLLLNTNLDKEQKGYVDIAIDSTNHLLTVVDDILDFSRIESGRLELEYRYFNLKQLIDNIYRSFQPIADKRGLALELQTDPGLEQWQILSDEARLRQIIINLVSNALKFTEDGGVFITVTCSGQHNNLLPIKIAVKDTGIGIADNQLSGIFNSFQQEDGSMVRRFGGSGLGLAIVKQLCTLMNAEISVTSQKGEGSVFTLSQDFSCQPHQETEASASCIQLPALSGKHVLVVEDNEVNQMVIQSMLKKLNIITTIASNGTQAIDLCLNHEYQLILMDCHMPEMDGFETTRWIRKEGCPNQQVPIIALTANVLSDAKEECLQAGMNDYLSKPLKLETLTDMLAKWLLPSTEQEEVEA